MTFRGPIYTRAYPPDIQDRFWEYNSLPLPINPSANQQGSNQYDWPNPRSSQGIDQTQTSNWLVFHGTVNQKPLNQYDWPLPVQPSRVDSTWIVADNNLLPQPTAVQFPFNQYLWTNPSAPSRLDYTYIWSLGNYPGNLYPVSIEMITPVDYPNPVYPARLDQTWISTGLALRTTVV